MVCAYENEIYMKKYTYTIVLVALFITALFLRLYALGRIPAGMTDDELRETYSAAALWHTGASLTSGPLFPFVFIVNNFAFTPVPIYLSAPIVGIFGVSLFTSKLPYALAGFFALIGTYFLVKKLTEHKWIALATIFCMTFNVWAIQLSRIAYEAVFAECFYIWGTYVFVSDWKKNALRSVCIAMALFFLAFNSYDAMKLIYLPLLLVLCVYKWKQIRSRRALGYTIIGAVIVTFGIFAYTYLTAHTNIRGSNFTIFQDTATANQSIASARQASLAPTILKILFHNKITYFFDVFIRHYLYTFSLDYLFLSQESSGIFSLWLRGNFYLIELPLIGLGALYLFLKKKSAFFLGIAAMSVGAIPAGVGPEPFSYLTRASFVLPWLALFVGSGIVCAVELVRKKWIVITLLGCAYLFVIGGYLNQYYFEWSRNNAVYFSKGVEDLAVYLSSQQTNYSTMEIANMSDTFFLHWALVTHMDVRKLQKHYASGNVYEFPPIKIFPSCKDIGTEDPHNTLTRGELYVANPSCHKQTPDYSIILPDGTPQWSIYKPKASQE